jgi:hypothetical protein
MSQTIIASPVEIVNLASLEVLIIRAFDKNSDWTIEVTFTGGVKVVTSATADEVNAIESELAETVGWRVNPSLYNNGFSARRLEVKADDPFPFDGRAAWYEAAR